MTVNLEFMIRISMHAGSILQGIIPFVNLYAQNNGTSRCCCCSAGHSYSHYYGRWVICVCCHYHRVPSIITPYVHKRSCTGLGTTCIKSVDYPGCGRSIIKDVQSLINLLWLLVVWQVLTTLKLKLPWLRLCTVHTICDPHADFRICNQIPDVNTQW